MDLAQQLLNKIYLQNRPPPDPRFGEYEPAQTEDMGAFLYLSREVLEQIERGNPYSDALQHPATAAHALVQSVEASFTGKGIDDRLHAFENVLTMLAKMDPEHATVQNKNNDIIELLYDTTPHPPAAYVGADHIFRRADGGSNNLQFPDLGRSGTPYARSVQSRTPVPIAELPDPGLVFDVLMKRRYSRLDDVNNHQNGNSTLTFAFASIVTHSLFRTAKASKDDPTKRVDHINNTSSYLDLSPLYGCNQAEQDLVRNKDGRGKLWPDVFSEDRLAQQPPAVSAILVIFNRNHNYICDMLLRINEMGDWKNPSDLPSNDAVLRQDEQIFQTAKLINCGHFMTMILYDYVAGFLGQTRNGQSWQLRPFNPIRRSDGTTVPRGEGNHVSVEFNLLYRWHAVIGLEDERWIEQNFAAALGTADWDRVSLHAFKQADPAAPETDDPRQRTFAGLQRGADGTFRDEDIADILQAATKQPAQRFGARGTPGVLRQVEILGMMQARRWNVCTMNDFREFLGLKRLESFEEWNSNPEVARAARDLYKHIDRLELYPGLLAEENLQLTYGSGFMCGYTLVRAILTDAICLVRGDRFYTTDFTPANLTTWGFQDCQPFLGNGAWGANLGRLFMRHLPRQYPYNSTYSLYPFFTPKAMNNYINVVKSVAVNGKLVYPAVDFTFPLRQLEPARIVTRQGIRAIFNNPAQFKVLYTDNMKFLTREYGFFLVFDDKGHHDADMHMCMRALWPDEQEYRKFETFYNTTTAALIEERAFAFDVSGESLDGAKYVDIVKQVINVTGVRWACDWMIGLPLKTVDNPRGLFTEQEAYKMLAVLFSCVFQDIFPENGAYLRATAIKVSNFINDTIESSLKQVMAEDAAKKNVTTWLQTQFSSNPNAGKPCEDFLRRLAKNARPIDELVACVVGLAVASSVTTAQVSAQVIDFYLDESRAAERNRIVELVKMPREDRTAHTELIGYIKEAQRLAPQFPGLFRVNGTQEPITIEEGHGLQPVAIQPGQQVFSSFYLAQTNPLDFPDPLVVNPHRPREDYMVQGTGFHVCPGVQYVERTLAEVLRVVFNLKNVRRAPGDMGKLSSFMQELHGTPQKMFLDADGKANPWPGSMFIMYDL